MDVVNFVSTNWVEILAVVTAAVVLAERIVKLTPTTRDDEAVAWVKRMLNLVALQKPNTGVDKTGA